MATAPGIRAVGRHDGFQNADAPLRSEALARTAIDFQQPWCGGLTDIALEPSTTTFRFLDLPTELRLLVYSELLERKDPDSPKRLYPNILATSKEIHREASPELYTKTTLRLTIGAMALKSRDCITYTTLLIGLFRKPIFINKLSDAITSAWIIYNSLPAYLGKIANIRVQILLRADRSKGLLKPTLLAEQFNQAHQIVAGLTAIWKISGALQRLTIEYLDETGIIQVPPSPPVYMSVPPAGDMEFSELKRIFHPLCGLSRNVVIDGTLPSDVMEHITERRVTLSTGLHAFGRYIALAAQADVTVLKVKNAGLCCTQVGSPEQKPCAIRRLEKEMAIVRGGIVGCRMRSEEDEEKLAMDLDAVDHFLESKKVRELVKRAEEEVVLCAA